MNNWGQIMINFSKPSSLSEPKINGALNPIVTPLVEVNLHSNDFIIERLSIRPIDAVKGHFDLSISRKYLIAKKPEWQVIYRSMLQRQDLKNLQSALEQVLLEQNEHAPFIKD